MKAAGVRGSVSSRSAGLLEVVWGSLDVEVEVVHLDIHTYVQKGGLIL